MQVITGRGTGASRSASSVSTQSSAAPSPPAPEQAPQAAPAPSAGPAVSATPATPGTASTLSYKAQEFRPSGGVVSVSNSSPITKTSASVSTGPPKTQLSTRSSLNSDAKEFKLPEPSETKPAAAAAAPVAASDTEPATPKAVSAPSQSKAEEDFGVAVKEANAESEAAAADIAAVDVAPPAAEAHETETAPQSLDRPSEAPQEEVKPALETVASASGAAPADNDSPPAAAVEVLWLCSQFFSLLIVKTFYLFMYFLR